MAKKAKRHEGIIATVAANVKRLRDGKKPKLSQEKLAFEADLDRTYISAVERRKRNITISVLARLAKALKARPAELVRVATEAAAVVLRQLRGTDLSQQLARLRNYQISEMKEALHCYRASQGFSRDRTSRPYRLLRRMAGCHTQADFSTM